MSILHRHGHADAAKQAEDLLISIKKATLSDEVPPKAKHVRSCQVYTNDNKSSTAFWEGFKVTPLLESPIKCWKALITIHKVIRDGHPIVVKEAQQQSNLDWIRSLRHGGGRGNYSILVPQYVEFLEFKLRFHRRNPEFPASFEYEEYVSLKEVQNSDVGYDACEELMDLQDQINVFETKIFASKPLNDCQQSALVPLVQDSYGLYKFLTSMLRAMHETIDADFLAPLTKRYNEQHSTLRTNFKHCGNLNYPKTITTIPSLPFTPPDLLPPEDKRPARQQQPPPPPQPAPLPKSPSPPPAPVLIPRRIPSPDAEPVTDFLSNQNYEDEQRRLVQQFEAEKQARDAKARQDQLEFERQQQANEERIAREQAQLQQYMRDQQQQVRDQEVMRRIAELQQENFQARAQYDHDQLMLQQFDNRTKQLEQQLDQITRTNQLQSESKDGRIHELEEAVKQWKSKYEALAKLYSELRREYLDLLQKVKILQLKANSAQEANDRAASLQNELKQKTMQMAGLIRERDRAEHDLSRSSGNYEDRIKNLERDIRLARDDAIAAAKSKEDLTAMVAKLSGEIAHLEQSLRDKARAFQANEDEATNLRKQITTLIQQKEVLQAGLDEHILSHDDIEAKKAENEGQMEVLMSFHFSKVNDIIDAVLAAAINRVDEAIYELDSPMQAGNQSATGPNVMLQIDKAKESAMDFFAAFNDFIVDVSRGEVKGESTGAVIRSTNEFAGVLEDVLRDCKGLTRLADDHKGDILIGAARESANDTIKFLRGVQSFRLVDLDEEAKQEVAINCNIEVQKSLVALSDLAATFTPKSKLTDKSGDLDDVVDNELTKAAEAIDNAVARLNKLKNQSPRGDQFSTYELEIHDGILDDAIVLTNAIARLIKAATESQQEYVKQERGTDSRAAFYKKHNHWTEGLVSAAKAVASSTNFLIETADGLVSGTGKVTHAQLMVASNEVAATTAQLVLASRVKAGGIGNPTQDRLEEASKAVTGACRALLRRVEEIVRQRAKDDGEATEFGRLSIHELKTREREQQIQIVLLKGQLEDAVRGLGDIRKLAYQDE